MTINQLPILPSADGTEKIPVTKNGVDYAATFGGLIELKTLVNGAGVNDGSVTIHGGRKLSDYKVLIAEWKVNGAIRATAICRKDSFVAATNLSLFYVDSGNTQRYVEVAYNDDTDVTLTASGNASGNLYLFGV